MEKRIVLYRGILKSCNYQCSYCPLSKRPVSDRELRKDRSRWEAFVCSLEEKQKALQIGAVMVVPYGEALIHDWYREGLARITRIPGIEAAGIQTNLSVGAKKVLEDFTGQGGELEKLRIWATFHPEMTKIQEFSRDVKEISQAGIHICAGAVGAPEYLEGLKELKKALPKEVYLWINAMDGLKRPYSQEEIRQWEEIDPYFSRELFTPPGNKEVCRERLLVEGDGRLRICNISPVLGKSWEELCAEAEAVLDSEDGVSFPEPVCARKRCSCYLAYGGRRDFLNQVLFGPYPVFRIPRRIKAAFFVIDNTLIPQGKTAVPQSTAAGLKALKALGCRLFFATSLPWREALRRCANVRDLFDGGIFAGGAHLQVVTEGEKREYFYEMEEEIISRLKNWKGGQNFRVLAFRQRGILYKITLLRPHQNSWTWEETEDLEKYLKSMAASGEKPARAFSQGNCLQIVLLEANKENGVKTICQWLGISVKEAAAAGDSQEDLEMMKLTGLYHALPKTITPLHPGKPEQGLRQPGKRKG